MMEHPGPPGSITNPHTGLIGLQDGAAEQTGADLARLTRESRPTFVEHVDQGSLTDLEPEQIRHQPRKSLE